MTENSAPVVVCNIRIAKDLSYILKSNGCLYIKENKTTNVLCSGLFVIGYIRNAQNTDWSLGLKIRDRDNVEHTYRLSEADLHSRNSGYFSEMTFLGLQISGFAQADRHVQQFFKRFHPVERYRLQTQTGWSLDRHAFLLPPDRIIKDADPKTENIFPELGNTDITPFCSAGSLKEWQDTVSLNAEFSSRLTLAICVVLSGPLHACSNVFESGGIHFFGKTSTGKSLTLRVAASVMMDPFSGLVGWNATTVGLEALATARNDGTMVMDEIGATADPEDIGRIIYMISNGVGKTRGTKDAHLATTNRWRCSFLSSGEITLSHIVETNPKVQFPDGIFVRFHELPLASGEDKGLFDNLPEDLNSSAELFSAVGDSIKKNYGVLGPAWIALLVEYGFDKLHEMIEDSWHANNKFFSIGNDPAARRAGKRFHLFGFAGEIATNAGLTGWSPQHSMDIAKKCYGEWASRVFPSQVEADHVVQQLLTDIRKNKYTVPYGESLSSDDIGWNNGKIVVLLKERLVHKYDITSQTIDAVKENLHCRGLCLQKHRRLSLDVTKEIAGDAYKHYKKGASLHICLDKFPDES